MIVNALAITSNDVIEIGISFELNIKPDMNFINKKFLIYPKLSAFAQVITFNYFCLPDTQENHAYCLLLTAYC